MTRGESVRELRKRLKLGQREFAQRAGISKRAVSKYETSVTGGSPEITERFRKIAKLHGYADLEFAERVN